MTADRAKLADRLRRLGRRIPLPFTLAMLGILVATAMATGSIAAPLPTEALRSWGFAPRDLPRLRVDRLVTSALFTHGADVAVRALAMVAVVCGVAERRLGSRRTAAAFWGVHLLTLLVLGLLLVGPRLASGLGLESFPPFPRDLGPSAGVTGCLVLWLRSHGRPGALVTAVLVGLLALKPWFPVSSSVPPETERIADLAHLLAVPIGWAVARRLGRE